MSARLTLAVAIVALMVASAMAAQSARMQIYATVLGEQGDPVRGLQSADLVLRDGGVRQGVLSAEPATEPLSVAIVASGLTTDDVADVARAIDEAARALLAQNSRTQVGIIGTGGSITLLTASQPGAEAAVRQAALDGRSVVDVVSDAGEALRAAPADRRVVFAIVRAPANKADDRSTRADRLAPALYGLHASLWTVEIGPTTGALWSPALESAIADASRLGGAVRERARSNSDVPSATGRIVNLLLSQYLVTYSWPDPMLSQFNLVTRHEAGRVLVPAWTR